MKTHPLIRALGLLLPNAKFEITQSRDWCSLTFAGQQLTISCNFPTPEYYNSLTAILPHHEFAIPGMLVADIAIVTQLNCEHGEPITIEALVIDEQVSA